MGLKSFLSSIFKKSKAEVQEEQVEEIQERPTTSNSEKRFVDETCEICRKIIGPDRYKRLQGHWFHKKCFKNQQRKALNGEVQ